MGTQIDMPTHSAAMFQRDQVRILRDVCPTHFVTHNLMGLFQELDYFELAKDLDHVSWDNYPVWGKPDVPYSASEGADLMRSLIEASTYIEAIEERQGLKIGCLQEIAWSKGWISNEEFRREAEAAAGSSYGTYLAEVLAHAEDNFAGS